MQWTPGVEEDAVLRRTSSSTSRIDESSELETAVDSPNASDSDAVSLTGSAHRPSRRHLIVQAAVRVFSLQGFAQTSIQEIAESAGMVPTAVYYHFASKEELFDTALGYAMDASTAADQTVRSDDTEADAAAFKDAVDAVWDWTDKHPDAARMLFLQVAGGATPGTRLLTKEYEDRRVQRTFDYFPDVETPANKRSAAAEHAARSLRARTMIATTTAIQPLRIEGGPLSNIAVSRLRSATADVCAKMIEGR
jgi:AcrR family transcriptional regulator